MRRVINIAENASHSSDQDEIGEHGSRQRSTAKRTGIEESHVREKETLIEASEQRKGHGYALTIRPPDSHTRLHCGIARNGRPAY